MQKILKYKILIITMLFILIRLPFLDQIFLLHDERDIAYSGYSIAQTGKDLYGKNMPLNFEGISPNNPMVAIYYSAFWSLFLPGHSVFYARLPYALISSLLIWIVYELIFHITGNKRKALLTSILFCFSPWIFHITRMALDIPLAIVLLLGGTLCLLKQKRILAYILLFLTFYSYQGFRLLIPFLVIYLETYQLDIKKVKSWLSRLLISIVFIFLLFGSTLIIDPQTTKGRFSEIVFFSVDNVKEVIFRRNSTIASPLISKIFDNKITTALDYMLTNLVKGQDLMYLFKTGDYSAINGNTASGQFIFIFIAFYYLGIASMGRKINKGDFFILGLIIIGMIPALLSTNGSSFSIRAMPTGIGFAYILALGLLFGWEIFKKLKHKKLIIPIITIALIINFSYVGYIYFFRRPVTVGEIFNEHERSLSKYLLDNKNQSYPIYHRMPQDGFLTLAFFDKELSISTVQKQMIEKTYTDNGFIFKVCNSKLDYKKQTQTIISEGCLDVKTYEYFANINNPKVFDRIPYKDYSLKTAYFVTR